MIRRVLPPLRVAQTWLLGALLHLPTAGRVVRRGPSAIHARGLFLLRGVAAGQPIGALKLGKPCAQSRHTLQIGALHRQVAKPWRFMNHSCTPTATLQLSDDAALLIAARDLHRYAELTIDYNRLPEEIGSPFECRCPRCVDQSKPERIGG
jgi:hypothetical protein